MSRIFRDSSVLNQFGSPSINSNTLANRPAFGQVGRLFVDTTNNVIYRDTGTSWVVIGGSGGSQNLQSVTTIGNTTTNNILVTARENLFSNAFDTSEIAGDTTQIINVGSNVNISNSVLGVYNIYSESYKTITQNVVLESDSNWANIGIQNVYNNESLSPKTITVNQGIGYINAISSLSLTTRFNSINALNISHFAQIVINNGSLSSGTITNYYGMIINPSSSTNITNRWGIYQAGANDVNYFQSSVLIGNNINNGFGKLQVNGSGFFDTNLYLENSTFQCRVNFGTTNTLERFKIGYEQAFYPFINVSYANIIVDGTGNVNYLSGNNASNHIFYTKFDQFSLTSEAMRIDNNRNILIGTITNTNAVKLIVNGNVEITTPTSTGIHTPTAQHLPIYVNNTLYYLQLLN
jgi:hypothetical protein